MVKKDTSFVVLVVLFLLLSFFVLGQGNSFSAPTGWSAKWQPSKLFIENKGQFKVPASAAIKSKVNYAYDEGGTKIFFTSKGLVYSFKEKKKKREEEGEREEKFKNEKEFLEKEREEKIISYKTDVVSMIWEGANPNVEIISEDKSSEYFSYAYSENGVQKNENFIYGYKKLTYKNLYPNIDVEYIFHPTDGIKYSFVLHPGADISQIKMTYSDRVKLNSSGEIHISTKFDDIIEHAPQSFYGDNKSSMVASKFIKTGKTVTFQMGDYDKSKTLVIDPWVQTPTIANSNCVWECEKDGAGNIYIIGGDVPMKLLKYNAAGAIQWTFTTAYDTSQNDWLGTFVTDLNGNSYVTCGASAALTKVNSAGSQVYSVTGGSNDEYWNIAFNCDQTKLVVGGTRLTGLPSITGSGVIFDINTANGSVNSVKTVGHLVGGGFGISDPDEVRSVTSSYNARYYYLTLDTIGAIDQNFSACPTASALFKTNHGFAFGYKCENYRPNNGNSGIMGIRANRYFVYTQNGKIIQKRALGSGAILASATIPGGISTASGGLNQAGNSGIDIDSCGNVYVGSGNSVIKYDANLNQLASTALPFAVYDVAVSYGGNVVVSGATGTSSSTTRTGYVQSINMSACNPMTLFCCDATICPAGPFCSTAPSVTLTPVTPGGTWSGAGVNASGVFNPATAGPGTHNIIYTLACGSDSIQITVNPCATLSVCANGSNLVASGGTPGYKWQTATTYTDCSGCFGGNCVPGFCNGVVTTSLTTIANNTTSIAAPATYPLIITDAAGNTYTVTSLGSVPPCSACTPPTPSVTATNSVTCFGAHTGSGTVTATPAGTYTYTWQPGNLTGASQTGLAAGVYTVTVSSSSTCSSTITVNIAQPTALTASITAASPASCGQNNGSITVTPSGGTSGYTYTWTPSGGNAATANNLAGGNYSVTVTDANSCTATATASVSTTSTPTLTVNSATVCSGNPATLIVSGATTYSWSPATNLNSTTSATVTATPTTTTIYTVTGSAGTCSSTATSTVTVNTTPTATATGTALVCIGQPINLGVTTTATTFAWSGPNTFTSNIQNPTINNAAVNNSGVYTVTVTANGCTAVSSISVTVTNSTSVTITPAGPFCSGAAAVNLNASVAGGTWSGTGITNANNGTFDPTVAGVGTYTITYVIGGSCGSSDSTVIKVNSGPTANATTSTPLVCAGQSISLNVNATAVATYSWSGPAAYSNNTQNPAIANATTTNSGIYTVTVSSGTCTAVDTVSVTVVSNPTITVNSATLCAGVSATLTANGAANYTWAPATGLSTTTGSVVVATPASTSTYTITGGVGTCTAAPATSTVTVNPSPTITVNNASICSSTSVTITVNGASSYSWSPGTGLNSTVGSQVVANPGASTTYTVVGTDVNGCQGTATLTVLNSPSISTTVTTHSVTCHGLGNGSATVTASGGTGSAYTYSWSPVGGVNSSAINIAAGSYTCTIKDSIGCTTTTTVSITQPSTLTVNVASGIICAGQSYTLNAVVTGGTLPYTYNWNNGTSTTNPYIISPASATSYTVVVTDVNGCIVTDTSVIIAVRPPLQVTTGDAGTCAGDTITLSATASGGTGTYNYSWIPGGLNGNTVAVAPMATTIYTVIVSDGCTAVSATDTGVVTVTPPPTIPPPNPASGCAPLCVTFTTPTGLATWQWNFGDGTTSNLTNPTHCYTKSGSFNVSLTYTTPIGCSSTATSNNLVNVYPIPTAEFSFSPNPVNILAPQVFFDNQSLNSNSWQWTFGDGTSSAAQNPSHIYGAIGVYPVMLIAQNQQGCRDTLRTSVTIDDIFTFYAPNAFTPDGDHKNPKFLPVGEGWNDKTYNLWVFDRWGNQIFKTQDPYQGWDGKLTPKSDAVQEDVYVWKVQLNDIFGKQHQYTGTVTLVK